MIRENQINEFSRYLSNSIVDSIKKSRVKNEIILYRGLHTPLSILEKNFIAPYLKNKVITGSLICSTSRNIERAIQATVNNKNEIPVVFEINMPKNGHALSIENVAHDANEQEFLLTSPKYIITDLGTCINNNIKYIKIYVKILED